MLNGAPFYGCPVLVYSVLVSAMPKNLKACKNVNQNFQTRLVLLRLTQSDCLFVCSADITYPQYIFLCQASSGKEKFYVNVSLNK